MKRTLLYLFTVSLSVLLISFTGQGKEQGFPQTQIKTVIIDPGHGGDFPGARGSFSKEADVSLSVSLKLGKALQQQFPDLKIIYTRTTDANAGNRSTLKDDLRYRADLANSSGGDLFISIHCNSTSPIRHRQLTGYKTATFYVGKGKKKRKVTRKVPQYHYWTTPNPAKGTETYIWAANKDEAKIQSISQNNEYGEIDSLSNITMPDPNDPAEKARMLIYTQKYFRKSIMFGDLIEQGFKAQGRVDRGGVKQRNDKGIWVLQAAGMPSVLVEIGFISNPDEEKYINSDKGQSDIVANIVNAFTIYKQKVESKSVNSQIN
ncbi:MAG: N-acetylmuramoyl-L-alanine amidase [Bacteroidetes bacterium]|nr:N-acetylmuramoyl-L-alanine amidase [Bacteroidota bacterium]MBS1930341.1 N-acetylmuramoyl-L-alanine amidase [Bacteroidota bacterium]